MQHALFLALAIVALAVIVAGLGAPMALGKVKRNGIYGFRTLKTMRDDATWDATNRFAGKALIGSGIVMVLLAATLPILSKLGVSDSAISGIAVAFEVGPILAGFVVSLVYAARLV
jgi:hypothetical protein